MEIEGHNAESQVESEVESQVESRVESRSVERDIEEIVNRETRAWNTRDVDLLMTIFHRDMVWPWPRTSASHDPLDWVMELGRYDYQRWKRGWQELFLTHRLVHNRREIKKIVVSREGDGAFAVVDIDTLWVDAEGREKHWKGRVCKVYARMSEAWKMTMQTGVLDYSSISSSVCEVDEEDLASRTDA